MEPVTHFLTGACIGRAGLNRKTAYATLAAVLAAEAADIDVLWGLAGPVEGLKHHRGITHTFIAVPVVAAAAVGVVWLLDRWWRTRRRSQRPMRRLEPMERRMRRPRSPQPVHWGWLYLDGADFRAEPPDAGLDEQLRAAAVFPLQSALVCGEFCVYCRAGAVGAACGRRW